MCLTEVDDMEERRSTDAQVLLLQQKLDDHIEEFQTHCEDEEKRWSHLIEAQERNTKCIEDLTTSTRELTESTRDIVSAWNAANGTVKTMSALGKFIKWLSGFAFLGGFLTWLFKQFPGA
jgi:transketolase